MSLASHHPVPPSSSTAANDRPLRAASPVAKGQHTARSRTRASRLVATVAVAGAILGTPFAALAGPKVALMASARTTVANDLMEVNMSVEREGPQVAPLNEAVLKELNAAIDQARRVQNVKAKLASLSTSPNYNNQGKPNGYRVSGRIVLVSTDFTALSALVGDLAQRLSFGSVSFQLTPQRRAQEEQALMKSAAEAFRAKAQNAAQAFDFRGYEIKTLSIGTDFNMPPPVAPSPRVQAMSAELSKAPPLPDEGGESEVVVKVTGEVELR